MTGLAADRLTVRLGRRAVLSDVTLALEPGRITTIIGPNGAGKTTLLRTLAGLVRPERGAVRWRGASLDRISAADRARAVAYLPQGGTVAWALPVETVVALGRLPHGESPERLSRAGREAVETAIAAVGLAGFERRPVTELSGGERARALLARALATQAPVLLADEPVAALDPRHQLVVLEVLRSVARAGGIVVTVMHDLLLAARFADEVVLLDQGRVEVTGTPAEVLTAERLAATFRIAASVTSRDGQLLVTPDRPLTVGE